jgi:hypothetical protein
MDRNSLSLPRFAWCLGLRGQGAEIAPSAVIDNDEPM